MPLLLVAVVVFGLAWLVQNQSPEIAKAFVVGLIIVVMTMLVFGPAAGTSMFILFLMILSVVIFFYMLPFLFSLFLVFVLFIGLIEGLSILSK
jgi:hypothetical protein